MKLEYLRHCKVLGNGQIHPLGIICVTQVTTINPKVDLSDGFINHHLSVWHQNLILASAKHWIARIEIDYLVITDPKNPVMYIRLDTLKHLSTTLGLTQILITASGYGIFSGFNQNRKTRAEQAFIDALNGVDPEYYDNSTYVRVDPVYAGQILSVIRFNDEQVVAYDQENKPIPTLAVDKPLAFDRWGAGPYANISTTVRSPEPPTT